MVDSCPVCIMMVFIGRGGGQEIGGCVYGIGSVERTGMRGGWLSSYMLLSFQKCIAESSGSGLAFMMMRRIENGS
ncbi:hypothetical protein DL95DRAFT_385026 [Leptodontidium sp. 2 PMI_412]|nr:hypothetical protein DL95DRAFT_385026 [Leptodontidium sp. 2 PMI_412]